MIDDSHKYEKPMEIILGKKFKLEVWETCLKTMLPSEVSEFLVDKAVSLFLNEVVCDRQEGITDRWVIISAGDQGKQKNKGQFSSHCVIMVGMGGGGK